jgi:hypothetical protein
MGATVVEDGRTFPCVLSSDVCEVHTEKFNGSNLSANQFIGNIEIINGSIVLGFNKNTMSDYIKSFYNNGHYTLTKNIVMPIDVTSATGLPTNFIINAGEYNYTENESYYIINF